MIQSSLLAKIAASMSTRWRGTSLTWKITGAFLGILLVFGIFVITIVYHLTRGLLYEQINKRTLALATNLSDAAAGQIPTKICWRYMLWLASTRFRKVSPTLLLKTETEESSPIASGKNFPQSSPVMAGLGPMELARYAELNAWQIASSARLCTSKNPRLNSFLCY